MLGFNTANQGIKLASQTDPGSRDHDKQRQSNSNTLNIHCKYEAFIYQLRKLEHRRYIRLKDTVFYNGISAGLA